MIDRRTDWQKSLNAKISLSGNGFQSTDRMLLKPNPPSGIGDYAVALGVDLSVAEAIVQKHQERVKAQESRVASEPAWIEVT